MVSRSMTVVLVVVVGHKEGVGVGNIGSLSD